VIQISPASTVDNCSIPIEIWNLVPFPHHPKQLDSSKGLFTSELTDAVKKKTNKRLLLANLSQHSRLQSLESQLCDVKLQVIACGAFPFALAEGEKESVRPLRSICELYSSKKVCKPF
jgi:hypothetical protein